MKRALLISLFLTSCFIFNSAVKAEDDGPIRVMSFNILQSGGEENQRSWNERKETLVEVVNEADPVFLGVQEARADQMDYLNERLEGYKSIGVGRDDGERGGEFMAIFYKTSVVELLDSDTFWLSETPEKPTKGWDAACFRTVTIGKFRCRKSGKIIVYANTHLDHMGTVAREESAKLILRKLRGAVDGDAAFFVTGDFNVTEDSEAYRRITAGVDDIPGLRDSNKVAKVREIAQEQTWHDFGKLPSDQPYVIDYVFVNDKVDVEKFQINPIVHENGIMASDHVSIVATLTLK